MDQVMKFFRDLNKRLDTRQWIYVAVLQGVGAGLVDLGLNYLVGYATYQKFISSTVPVWGWPNLIGGQVIVETLVESLLTWLIVGTMTSLDIRNGRVAPLVQVDLPRFLAKLETKDLLNCKSSSGCKRRCAEFGRVLLSGLKYAGINILIFSIPTVCILMIIEAAKGPFTGLDTIWISAIYGALLGVFITPLVAVCALVQRGQTDERNLQEEAAANNQEVQAVSLHENNP